MLCRFKALSVASVAALVVGLLAGLIGLAASTPETYWDGWHWSDTKLLLAFATYNVVLGLIPGLVAHSLLAKFRLTGVGPYLGAAALIGGSWCIAMPLSFVWAYVLPCALAGTATFWVVRRPDRADATAAKEGIRAA